MYYLSDRFQTAGSSGGIETDSTVTSKVQKSFSDMFGNIAQNNYGVQNANISFPATSSIDSSGFQTLPAYNTIDFGGMDKSTSSAVYSTFQNNYSSYKEGYTQFSKMSDQLASGALLSQGLEGLSTVEQQVNSIVDKFKAGNLVTNENVKSIDQVGEAMSFGTKFSANSRDSSVAKSSTSEQSLGQSNCCCGPWITNEVKKIDTAAKEIIPKESDLIAQANKIADSTLASLDNQLKGNFREGAQGSMMMASSGEYYLDAKETLRLLETLKQIKVLNKTVAIAKSKANILDLEETLLKRSLNKSDFKDFNLTKTK